MVQMRIRQSNLPAIGLAVLLAGVFLHSLAVPGEQEASPGYAPPSSLLGAYEQTRDDNFLSGVDAGAWCIDRGNPRLTISTAEGTVWIHGTSSFATCHQTGISFCVAPITSPRRLECVIVIDVNSRDTAFVLEFYSLDVGCALAQVRCNTDEFSFDAVVRPCPTHDVYPAANSRHFAFTGRRGPGVYSLRMLYDAEGQTITGYTGDRLIGTAPLPWAPGRILVRLFA
jgi:hypothetical protein